MIPEKLKAARAYLDWTQGDLADKSGIKTLTIAKFENNKSKPTVETIEKLQKACENEGIIFTKHGIEKRDIWLTHINDENWFIRVLNDVEEHLKGFSKKELLIDGSDEELSPNDIIQKFKELRKAKVKMRKLVKDGDTYLMGKLDEYRYTPDMFYMNLLILIYGDRVVIERGDLQGCTIYHDPALAELHRKKFDYQWYNFDKPKTTTAKERF